MAAKKKNPSTAESVAEVVEETVSEVEEAPKEPKPLSPADLLAKWLAEGVQPCNIEVRTDGFGRVVEAVRLDQPR